MRTRMIAGTVLLLFACRHPSTSDRERPSTTVAPAPDTGTNQFFEPETFGEAPPDFSWWTSEPMKVHPKTSSRDAMTWWSWRDKHFEDNELAMSAPIISSQVSAFHGYQAQYSEEQQRALRDDLWVVFGAPFNHDGFHAFECPSLNEAPLNTLFAYEVDDFVFAIDLAANFMMLLGPDALREGAPSIPPAYVPLWDATRSRDAWGHVTIYLLFPGSQLALERTMGIRNFGSLHSNRRAEDWFP